MPSTKIRTYFENFLENFGAPFWTDTVTHTQRTEGALPGSKPLNCLLRLFGKGYNRERSGSEARLRLVEEGAVEGRIESVRSDAQTQTPEWKTTFYPRDVPAGQQIIQSESNPSCAASEPCRQANLPNNAFAEESHTPEGSLAAEAIETTQTVTYPNRNRIALANDRLTFLLTKESVDRLHQIIVASQRFKKCQSSFKEAEREAGIGESFMENSESQIEDPNIPEHIKHQISQDLERQKPSILTKIQRKADLERELCKQTINLEYLRDQSDDVFEQMMTEVGIIEEPGEAASSEEESESGLDIPQTENDDSENIDVPELGSLNKRPETPRSDSEMDNELHQPTRSLYATQDELHEKNPEIDMARQEHHQAFHKLRSARQEFDEREEAYLKDVERYADGVEYSREDIDLFHLQSGMELTTNLKEAEEEFERTRARAAALGIVTWSTTSSNGDIADINDHDDGYLDSEDPANNADMTDYDREVIDAWSAEVDMIEIDSIEESVISETPAIEWEAESVNMSDSVSVCDGNPRQRKRIDQWRKQQELLREMDFGIVEY